MASTVGTVEKSLSTDRVHLGRDRRRRRALTSACALLLLSLVHAAEAALDPAGVAGSVFFNLSPPAGISVDTFGTFPLTGPGGFLQLTASGEPAPFLSAEATVSQGFTGRVSAILEYSMQIVGPAGPVPMEVQVAGGASASSVTNDLFAGFAMKVLWGLSDVTLGLVPVFEEGINTPALQGIFNESFGHTVELTLTANHVYRVRLTADAFIAAGSSTTLAFATAFVDPVFSFGPGVGSEYSLVFSEGIGNSAPVPEPSTWVLLLAGALVLGLRRARDK